MEAIYITDHALDRYRERIAARADADKAELIRLAREAERGNPWPLLVADVKPGHWFLYHAGADCVLVCDERADGFAVVTVRRPAVEGRNFLNPKKAGGAYRGSVQLAADPALWVTETREQALAFIRGEPPPGATGLWDATARQLWWRGYLSRLGEIAKRFPTAKGILTELAWARTDAFRALQRVNKELKAIA